MARLIELRRRVEAAWSVDTTYCPDEYAGQDPAFGQCGVTSIYLHCYHGARLYRGTVNGRPHFFVELDGALCDWTWRQFQAGAQMTEVFPATYLEICQDEWMAARCSLFARRVESQVRR